jgi:hypothetical protein
MMISSSSVAPWTRRCSSSIRRDQKPDRLRRSGSGFPVPSNGVRRASIESARIYLHLADGWLAAQYRKAAEAIDAQTLAVSAR